MVNYKPVYICVILLPILFLFSGAASAQKRGDSIRLYGYVVAGDNLDPQVGVVVYVPGTKRGTLTQLDGYFNLNVLPGDSVVVSALGFESQFLKIPASINSKGYTIDITLRPSIKKLPTVNVMPWATERDLKRAVLQVELPEAPQANLDFQYVRLKNSILNAPALDAKGNFKYFNQQQTQQRESRFRVPEVVKLFSVGIN